MLVDGLGIAKLSKVSFNSYLQYCSLLFIRANNQHSVIARDRSNNLRPVFIIDAGCYWLGTSSCCYQYKKILCLAHFQTETFKYFTDSW